MSNFKIGDVVYHKAGNKLLGTICGIGSEKVTVRKIDNLMEIEMYPEELKSDEEYKAEMERLAQELQRMNEENSKKYGDY